MTTETKAIIYARTANSSADIKEQVDFCRAYLEECGFTEIRCFEDAAVAGVGPRPIGLTAAIEALSAGEASVIVVKDSARLSRDMESLPTIVSDIEAAGGRVFIPKYGDSNDRLKDPFTEITKIVAVGHEKNLSEGDPLQ